MGGDRRGRPPGPDAPAPECRPDRRGRQGRGGVRRRGRHRHRRQRLRGWRTVNRRDGRGPGDLRPVSITLGWQETAYASALVEMGRTKVVCAVSVDDRAPQFRRGSGKGWVTAEYSMLPGATNERSQREAARGKQGGRTLEIQRLIGRSLRSVVDMKSMGESTLWVDCDVLQADGGTRCASITGAWVALFAACARLVKEGRLKELPVMDHVAAVSAGIIDGTPCLDLPYEEDVRAG